MPAKRGAASVSLDASPSKTKVARVNADAEDLARAAGSGKADPSCTVSGAVLCQESDGSRFDAMLNQTDIANNNNKFYVLQLVSNPSGQHYVFTRWGRVGEGGATQQSGPFDRAAAEKEFRSKFKSKTGNDWDQRRDFQAKKGKYELLELDTGHSPAAGAAKAAPPPAAADGGKAAAKGKGKGKKAEAAAGGSSLDAKTQDLVEWILNADMFKDAMTSANLDVKKMPLGSLSQAQVAKGIKVLEEIDAVLRGGDSGAKKANALEALSGKFYQIIPHSFGRQRPPVIDTQELLKEKFDLVAMLGDIEIAQAIQKDVADNTDAKYAQLQADLTPLNQSDDVVRKIRDYIQATGGDASKLLEVWTCNRHGEGARFAAHDKLDNRRLLWHGTNIAVVAAILKSGLRIMPTASSGSRVGRGIYLASEHSKSRGYVGTGTVKGESHGIMFLCEAAMGKAKEITRDDSSLVKAPAGFDSIIARGTQEPDSKKDTHITLDGKKVLVPQGNPIPTGISSSFYQSEYLVYQESQVRIRYVLRFKF